MSFSRPVIDEVIPSEYRTVAEDLYPSIIGQGDDRATDAAAAAFAACLGLGAEFSAYLLPPGAARAAADRRLLGHFRNNVELLIQKTWVEKADEAHKEKLLDRVPVFVAEMEKGDYERALKTFIHIAEELAYLLFGSQSRKGDFIAYASRIDPPMGLFWWYSGNLASILGSRREDAVRSVLLIGVAYLASM
jgi:hypothetical protein